MAIYMWGPSCPLSKYIDLTDIIITMVLVKKSVYKFVNSNNSNERSHLLGSVINLSTNDKIYFSLLDDNNNK